jgi:DNA-binding beta-propeller fold protein YncE
VLATIYVLLYSTFFADPLSLVNGLYAGLAYWLGSQQEAARGDQPWYYHLILLSIYEPLALFGGLSTAIYLYTRGLRLPAPTRPAATQAGDAEAEETQAPHESRIQDGNGEEPYPLLAEPEAEQPAEAAEAGDVAVPPDADHRPAIVALFPLFLAFWFLGALVSFSWAGEKMPWLVTHIALPGNLLVAWALGRMLEATRWRDLKGTRAALIPGLLALTILALGVAYWRISTPATDLQGQSSVLQGLVPLLVGGGALYGLLTIGQRAGWRATAALCGLTVAAVLGASMVRSTWMVVYDHPDTPVEPLVYVQSSPDVPLIVREIRELAINQTRNVRSENDPVGGLTMPVIMDAGDAANGGEGSLAWPYQWYFRDFKRLENRDSDFFRKATPESYIVDPVQPGAERALAPIVMVSKGSLTSESRTVLEVNYLKRYDAKLNWWFPEGYKCDPASPGYKRFYYSNWMAADALRDCPSLDPTTLHNVFAPLLWPFDTSHWGNTWKYLVYRELPAPLRLDGREMEIWLRRDLAPTGEAGAGAVTGGAVKLVAQQIFGSNGTAAGQLSTPSSAAVDAQGNLYVADSLNHRIQVFGPDGAPARTIGSFGTGDGQLFEPRGVAVDQQGNIYVADTWNARVAKFGPDGQFLKAWGSGREDFGNGRRASPTNGTLAGNAAEPLGFFGPRGIAVDELGNVYIADTGNKRVVVTDSEGNYRYQWGEFGAALGQFSEPTGVAVDGGTVYVADTWNGRVQAFLRDAGGQASATPVTSWRVPGWQPETYDDPFITARGGQVAVSVPGRHAILLTDATGKELLRWGGQGDDFASLKLPSGLAFAPDGTLFVVDRGNSRIMQFKLPLSGR